MMTPPLRSGVGGSKSSLVLKNAPLFEHLSHRAGRSLIPESLFQHLETFGSDAGEKANGCRFAAPRVAAALIFKSGTSLIQKSLCFQTTMFPAHLMLITGSGVFHQEVRRGVISEYSVSARVRSRDWFLRNNKQMELAARALRPA